MTAKPFPGQTISRGSSNSAAVKAIQNALNARGCGPITVDGRFGDETDAALRLFQMRFPDAQGRVLTVDGEAGAITWAALFGSEETVPKISKAAPLGRKALDTAITQIGVMEKPVGSNSGPEVEQYLKSVGLGPGFAWCAAFTYWCVNQVAAGDNPLPKSGGVQDMWTRASGKGLPTLKPPQARAEPKLIAPGMLFFVAHDGGTGHTGFIEGMLPGGLLSTVEGNTNDGGTREGIGVFRLKRRPISSINLGFVSLG